MDQRIIDLYDEYTHRPLDRRVFLERLVVIAGGAAAATALLPLLESDYAFAEQMAADDPRIEAVRVTYEAATGSIVAYLARPRKARKAPAVIVIHENRGLNPHIEDVARRVATAGFLALAPDLLSSVGGTPAGGDEAREAIVKLDAGATLGN